MVPGGTVPWVLHTCTGGGLRIGLIIFSPNGSHSTQAEILLISTSGPMCVFVVIKGSGVRVIPERPGERAALALVMFSPLRKCCVFQSWTPCPPGVASHD